MHKKYLKFAPVVEANSAEIHLYHSSKIAKGRPHSVERPEYTSVQSSGQWLIWCCVFIKSWRSEKLCLLQTCALIPYCELIRYSRDSFIWRIKSVPKLNKLQFGWRQTERKGSRVKKGKSWCIFLLPFMITAGNIKL